jgi:hypothetical protein
VPYQQPAQPYQPQPYQPTQQRERVIRNARGEERLTGAPAVSRVHIPTPEEAGVASPGAVDWSSTRRQLAGLKAVGFGLVPKARGVQFYIDLPGGKRALGEGRTEAEAVHSALADARRAH